MKSEIFPLLSSNKMIIRMKKKNLYEKLAFIFERGNMKQMRLIKHYSVQQQPIKIEKYYF